MRVTVRGASIRPGLVDLQINGCYGIDFATASVEAILEAARRLPETGTTAFCPTVISCGRTIDALRNIARAKKNQTRGARILGAHLEGPWLSPAYRGVHDPKALRRPSLRDLRRWLSIGVRMITLAPELPGAIDVIRAASRRGVLVSLGHTAADDRCARAAIEAGARCVTHLFNAMRPLHHRDGSLLAAALEDDRVACGLIYDRVHVGSPAARLALRCKPPGKLFLVSDAMPALGLRRWADGRFALREGVVRDRLGRLAGTRRSLLECATFAREDLGPHDLRAPGFRFDDRIAVDASSACRAAWIGSRLAYSDPGFVNVV